MSRIDPIELLRRQYLQLLEPDELTWPTGDLLRLPETQAKIFDGMFNDSKITFPVPDRYKIRVLKKSIKLMSDAIEDPEEDEISDEISAYLAEHMVLPSPSEFIAAQRKSYVTYTPPLTASEVPSVTILETPLLLASSGTTGLRTWEAALFLGAYLASNVGRYLVHNKAIIELGAGTGFLSIFCAKYLGTRYVLATDGSKDVIADIKSNLKLNTLREGDRFQTSVLQWGHAVIDKLCATRQGQDAFDLIIGTDVTYDVKSIPALMATLRDLFQMYPCIQALISATIRKPETVDAFYKACLANKFVVRQIDAPHIPKDEQIGFFYPATTPIDILLITRE